ncbi:hypothetical protein NMY22_g7657 [Coprinellus aureogranulatus]|nr:hypothetical protein NMY22_g7657 [Coprinellus aureogranulatus]
MSATAANENSRIQDSPIRLTAEGGGKGSQKLRGKVLTLGGDALEIVGVVLEAENPHKSTPCSTSFLSATAETYQFLVWERDECNVGFWRNRSLHQLSQQARTRLESPGQPISHLDRHHGRTQSRDRRKTQGLEEDPVVAARPTKYMRRGDLERLKEEQERKAQEEKRKREEEEARLKKEAATERLRVAARKEAKSKSPSFSPAPGPHDSRSGSEQPKEAQFNLSNEECIRRLRAKGQPIRLFAESDKDRRLRLRALELIEEKDHERLGGQNDFKKALEDVENAERETNSKGTKGKKKDGADVTSGESLLDLELVKTDPDKLYPIIYYALKRILKEWGESMDERPVEVKQSRQGKLAAATQVQSAEYLKPLFKQLRSRSLPSDMLARIAEIVHYMQKRQYQKANDSYLRLSIGNAPWPIGVTMVGIHERSAREKISADQVAHVLNDETYHLLTDEISSLRYFAAYGINPAPPVVLPSSSTPPCILGFTPLRVHSPMSIGIGFSSVLTCPALALRYKPVSIVSSLSWLSYHPRLSPILFSRNANGRRLTDSDAADLAFSFSATAC